MDLNRLREDAVTTEIDWSEVFSTSPVGVKLNVFNSLLTQLYDVHATVRPVRNKHLFTPWLTAEIAALQNLKTRLPLDMIRCYDASSSNKEKYIKFKNRCIKACRDVQWHHIHKSVLEESDSTKIWKFLSRLELAKSNIN